MGCAPTSRRCKEVFHFLWSFRPDNKTNNLGSLRGLELQRQCGLNRNRPPVQHVGPELPLLHAVDRGAREQERSLKELGILHRSIAAHQNLQDHRSLLSFGVGGIGNCGLGREQGAFGSFGDGHRLYRGQCGFHRLVTAGIGTCGGHLRPQALRNAAGSGCVVRLRGHGRRGIARRRRGN
jgi:hypothetical protein